MNLKEALQRYAPCDALWVHKEENVRYLSGFTGDSTDLLLTPEGRWLLTDSRYTEQAAAEAAGWEVVDHRGKLTAALHELCEKQGVRVLGLEEEALSLALYRRWLDADPEREWRAVGLDRLRMSKSEAEIESLRRACAISVDALTDILPLIQAGKTENEVRIALEKAMLDKGSERPAFATIVASGIRSALPHGTATDKVIDTGDFVTLDFGAVYAGYHADMTRTFVIGTASPRQRELYAAVLRAQAAAIAATRAGSEARIVDAAARDILQEAGLAEYFIHSTGHGVGLEIHEEPRISQLSREVLADGMVITAEPGVYLPGYGGLRIEDSLVVRGDNAEILTDFPKELMEL